MRFGMGVCSAMALLVVAGPVRAAEKRPMTFMDIMEMRRVGAGVLSPDGSRVLYTVGVPNWKAAKTYGDIWVAETATGKRRQLTFTKEKNESALRWLKDGRFCFLSDREGSQQVFVMSPDGGEARPLTEAKDGVTSYEVTRDGRWMAYLAGKADDRQLWILDLSQEEAKPVQLTKGGPSVRSLAWAEDGSRVFFLRPDSQDKDDQKRKEKKFDVKVADEAKPAVHLWSVDLAKREPVRLTEGADHSIIGFEVSPTLDMVVLQTLPTSRGTQDITLPGAQIRLMTLATRAQKVLVPRMGTGAFAFSPDGKRLAFEATDRLESLRNEKLFVVDLPQGEPRMLMKDLDASVGAFQWSENNRTLFFHAALGMNQHLFQVDSVSGQRTQLTDRKGIVTANYDRDAHRFVVNFTDPTHPSDLFVATRETLGKDWVQVSQANPKVAEMALGEVEAVRWKGRDGVWVEGQLVKPLGWQKGKAVPLIVDLHGGPAAADVNRFNAYWGSYDHVFAAGGYAVLHPNYRGSDNYGEAFRRQIGGNFMRISYADIMAGVDHLVSEGVADANRLGMMGWSAGGHLSNWTLTQTDRFKAISTGAGTVNWVSMYAQSDHQEGREFYLKGRPYQAWDNYVNESAIKNMHKAKTPTLIHVGEADERVPKPQCDELHMALKKAGVPVEYIVYPGQPHSLREPRYQLVKMVSEYAWFEKWIKGEKGWFNWKTLLDTLEEEKKDEKPEKAEKPEKGEAAKAGR